MRDLHVQEWPMGYDGWVRDVTVRLPRLDSLQLGLLLLDVHRLLFATSYKAQTLSLSANATAEGAPLDLSVSAAELRRWLVIDAERFAWRGTGQGESVRDLLARDAYGVHYSVTPGLILWVLPRGHDIARFRASARRWALDADIILGAVIGGHSVAIVARERRVPPEFLPPLRFETILQLAAATNEHLAQSYERTFVLAGKLPDGIDWAPIYLSPELIDTEYGSLLNLTDQMLKSWSEHGSIRYVNFRYPAPRRFPFATALSNELHAARVTFNWNTKGAGYVASDDTLSVYALNRTGALPVSYFAGDDDEANDSTLSAERRAYAYFAALGDPNLARVVQYAALYQLFRAFDVRGDVTTPPPPAHQLTALRPYVRRALTRLLQLDSATAAGVTDANSRRKILRLSGALRAVRDQFGDSTLDRIATRLVTERDAESTARDARLLARIAPHDTLLDDVSEEDQRAWVELGVATQAASGWMLRMFTDQLEDVQTVRAYAAAAAPPTRPWVHTATLVLSANLQRLESTGGHNLDAAVTRFRAEPGMTRGQVRVMEENGRRVILTSEDDIRRLSGDLRTIAGAGDDAALESHLRALLDGPVAEAPVRPRLSTIVPPPRLAERGLPLRRGAWDMGYGTAGRELTLSERSTRDLLSAERRTYTGVTRLDDGQYEIILGSTGEVLHAPNVVSALDLVSSQPFARAGVGSAPVGHQYQLYGFSDLDAAAFSRDIELALQRRGRQSASEDLVGVVVRDRTEEGATLRAATRDLDLTTAQVRSVRETSVEVAGRERRAYEVDVEVLSKTSRQPLHIRIWIFFRDGVVRPVVEAVQVRLASIFKSLGPDVAADVAAAVIRSELRRSFGAAIDHVHLKMDDVTLVDAPPTVPVHGSGRDHAAV